MCVDFNTKTQTITTDIVIIKSNKLQNTF